MGRSSDSLKKAYERNRALAELAFRDRLRSDPEESSETITLSELAPEVDALYGEGEGPLAPREEYQFEKTPPQRRGNPTPARSDAVSLATDAGYLSLVDLADTLSRKK
jgi:hypothetical protein